MGVVSQIKDLDNTPKTANGKLYLSDEEFIWARNALNALRDEYITAERYTDGIDAVMMKLMKAKYRNCKEIAAKKSYLFYSKAIRYDFHNKSIY